MKGSPLRPRLRAGLALAAVGLLVVWLWPRDPVPPPVEAPLERRAPAAVAPPPAPPEVALEPRTESLRRLEPEESEPVRRLRDLAADYRAQADFPGWSHAIDDGVDPVVRDRTPSAQRSIPSDLSPVLVIRAEQISFEAPQPIVIHAALEDPDGRIVADAIRGELRDLEGAVVWSGAFQLVLAGEDGAPGPSYSAQFVPQLPDTSRTNGIYTIEVVAAIGDQERAATTSLLYGEPRAKLTGRFEDRIEDGSLRIDAEVEVFDASRFHLEGTLAVPAGRAIAWGQFARHLEPGIHWLPLTFHGLAVSRSGADGPYELRSLALQATGEMPGQKNDLWTNAHRTAAYAADEFTTEGFGDAHLIELAERLERRASERARSAPR